MIALLIHTTTCIVEVTRGNTTTMDLIVLSQVHEA